VAQALSKSLAARLRSLLRAADLPNGAAGTSEEWRAARDRWLDVLDPRQPHELDESDIRGLIDFLSEAGPNRSSRRTAAEWSSAIDALVPELLFVGR
jgi:hypothetical protein